MARVQIESVSKSFAEGGGFREVLTGLDWEVAPGELVALLGRSGSGKSTLLNLIAAIESPTSGRITIDGVPVSHLGERERTLFRRRHIGFVFQFFNLLPTLTVAENVALPLALLGRDDVAEPSRRLLEAVGLGEREKVFPDRLSGGEQQRVAVARALIHDPALVLADEPTGALDAETGQGVLALLLDLARHRQKTVILVTHSPEVAAAADRVFTLDKGRLRPLLAS